MNYLERRWTRQRVPQCIHAFSCILPVEGLLSEGGINHTDGADMVLLFLSVRSKFSTTEYFGDRGKNRGKRELAIAK